MHVNLARSSSQRKILVYSEENLFSFVYLFIELQFFSLPKMPGIFEQNDGAAHSNTSEMNNAEHVSDESSVAADDSTSSIPPAEVNQTDKINKFLLKSFLERMNNETMDTGEENDESTENAEEREWQWNGRSEKIIKSQIKIKL